MSNYGAAAFKGAIIGLIVVKVIQWIATHFLLLMGILFGIILMTIFVTPFFNDNINKSEINSITDKNVHFDYDLGYQNTITYSLSNFTPFVLENITVDCGAGVVELGSAAPGEQMVEIRDMVAKPTVPYKNCAIDYTAVQIEKKRSNNVIMSEV